jgi:hypothetical protein
MNELEELIRLREKSKKVQKQMDQTLFYIWAFIIIVGCLAVLIYGL